MCVCLTFKRSLLSLSGKNADPMEIVGLWPGRRHYYYKRSHDTWIAWNSLKFQILSSRHFVPVFQGFHLIIWVCFHFQTRRLNTEIETLGRNLTESMQKESDSANSVSTMTVNKTCIREHAGLIKVNFFSNLQCNADDNENLQVAVRSQTRQFFFVTRNDFVRCLR